jgi:glutaredoxin
VPALTLIGKPGCHLCDDARVVITEVLGEFDDVELTELSIFDDAALASEYSEDIPVLLVDGRVHSTWRVDPARLRAKLLEAS